MTPDNELLRRYAETKSEEAFAELVGRHVNLVYSAVLRRLNGDPHLAQDAAQTVFADLARKASVLSRRGTLTGWLYTSAHYAAAEIARRETRRRRREEIFMREPVSNSIAEPDWEKLRPVLEDVMHQLKEADREAILLRYFENRPLAQVGAKLGLGENAARMRVDRALERMRALLAKRGVVTTEALAAAISANAVGVAPAGMASALATNAAALAGPGTLTLINIMTATQIKFGLGALVVAGMTTALVVQHQTNARLGAENAALSQELAQSRADAEGLSNRVAAASAGFADGEQRELARLRGDVATLRKENRRLQTAITTKPKPQVAAAAPTPAEDNESPEVQQKRMAEGKLHDAKLLALAQILYAEKNQGQFATNFDEIVANLKDESPLTGSNMFELTYHGLMGGITNAGSVILMREAQPWQTLEGQWAKSYVFADGHSEIHIEADGNFDSYEQARTGLQLPAP